VNGERKRGVFLDKEPPPRIVGFDSRRQKKIQPEGQKTIAGRPSMVFRSGNKEVVADVGIIVNRDDWELLITRQEPR